MSVSGSTPPPSRYRAFYKQPAPVEFDVELPDDIDGPEDLRQFLIDEAPSGRRRTDKRRRGRPKSTVERVAEAIALSCVPTAGALDPREYHRLAAVRLSRLSETEVTRFPARSMTGGPWSGTRPGTYGSSRTSSNGAASAR